MSKEYSAGDKLPARDVNEIVRSGGLYASSATGNDDYAITVSPAIDNYTAGDVFRFKADVANTGPATLNVCGKGAKGIKKSLNIDLVTGDIKAGQVVTVQYDGTNFQMISPSAPIGYACGVGTDFEEHTASGTTDQTVTVGFRPRKIRLTYFVQGYRGGQGLRGSKGIATFSETTLVANCLIWGDVGGGVALSADNAGPTDAGLQSVFDAKVADTSPIQGGGSGSNNGSWVTVTINSITDTGFVLRCVVSKDDFYSANQRFKFFWEAFI